MRSRALGGSKDEAQTKVQKLLLFFRRESQLAGRSITFFHVLISLFRVLSSSGRDFFSSWTFLEGYISRKGDYKAELSDVGLIRLDLYLASEKIDRFTSDSGTKR